MEPGQMTTSETVEVLKGAGQTQEQAEATLDQIVEADEKRRRAMAPAGTLYLPERLEKARWDYGIPDGAFANMPLSDRIFLYRPKSRVPKTFVEGGIIQLAPVTEKRERNEASEGILVAWGLKAMDELVPYGVELGMVVGFIQMAPWMRPIGRDPGDDTEDHVIVLRSDHLVDCKTLEETRRAWAKEGHELVAVVDHETARGTTARTHTIAGFEKVMPVLQEDY